MDEKRRRMTEVHSAYRGRERDAQEREAQRFLQLSAQRKAQRAADRLDREAEAEADETQELLPPSAGGAPPPAAAEVAAALSPPRRGRRQARRSEAQRLLSSEPLASPPPAALATPATLALVGYPGTAPLPSHRRRRRRSDEDGTAAVWNPGRATLFRETGHLVEELLRSIDAPRRLGTISPEARGQLLEMVALRLCPQLDFL